MSQGKVDGGTRQGEGASMSPTDDLADVLGLHQGLPALYTAGHNHAVCSMLQPPETQVLTRAWTACKSSVREKGLARNRTTPVAIAGKVWLFGSPLMRRKGSVGWAVVHR